MENLSQPEIVNGLKIPNIAVHMSQLLICSLDMLPHVKEKVRYQ